MMTNLERVLGLVGMALIGLSAVVVDIRITARGNIEPRRKQHPSVPFEPLAQLERSPHGAPNSSVKDAGKQEPCL
jgi:hypothetical protein